MQAVGVKNRIYRSVCLLFALEESENCLKVNIKGKCNCLLFIALQREIATKSCINTHEVLVAVFPSVAGVIQ